ncbi:MAG TPA: 2-amino-4-hydroxy-6-hydroxymethyldihydropteridine diphosphokinase [Balneolaceae bacterium]|nr:2-amino-4-hydroxy-6-hydroxymethyldihydropteridine diphosphokinase [Balneolaceae bacterium]
MMNSAVIALGSNIEPEKHIEQALHAIAKAFQLRDKSDFIYTAPIGIQEQPNFLNGVALVESDADQETIIDRLKQIEDTMGRDRSREKYGPRCIDLDLVVFNSCILDKDVYNRDFLQRAIHEVLPELEIDGRRTE